MILTYTQNRYVPIGAYAGVKPGSRDSYQRLSFVSPWLRIVTGV